MYTVEIQVSNEDGTIWQAVHPAEDVAAEYYPHLGGATAAEVAAFVAGNQNVAEGTHWRVCVWHGTNADTSTNPAVVVYARKVRTR